ncbi:hypothetical protein PIB30_033742 [Stylosanthes scabra]|uniref:Uncharacterized protein n=1 Tax=Stylosanthes scabra TaxID=79078 RepID=A0ABU6QC18_9FABA|nr:hypothetical protein [Stylosanthes scabra]
MAPLIWSFPLHAKAPLRSREESSPSPLPLPSPSPSPSLWPQFISSTDLVTKPKPEYIGKLGRNMAWSTLRMRYFMDIEELIISLGANLVSGYSSIKNTSGNSKY